MTDFAMTLELTQSAPEQVPSRPTVIQQAVTETVPIISPAVTLVPILQSSVQYEAAFGGGAFTLPPMYITAGNLICIVAGSGDTIPNVTDSAGNTYTMLTETTEGPSHHTRLAYCLSALTTGSVTITINSPLVQYQGRRGIAMQFGPGKSFGGVNVGVSNGSSTFTTPAYSTGAGIVVCGLYATGGNTDPHGIHGGFPDTTPFTQVQMTPGSNVTRLFGLYLNTGGQSSQTYQVTNTASNHLIRFMSFN